MLFEKILERTQRLIKVEFDEQDKKLPLEISRIESEAQKRGVLTSSYTPNQIYKLYELEVKIRADLVFKNLVKVHKSFGSKLTETLLNDLKVAFSSYVNEFTRQLSESMYSRLKKYKMQDKFFLDKSLTNTIQKYEIEIDIYIDSLQQSSQQQNEGATEKYLLKSQNKMKQFEYQILLEPEQEELLNTLVEASRNLSRTDRQKFYVIEYENGGSDMIHPGLPDRKTKVYIGDIEVLANENLVSPSYNSQGSQKFDVTPKGFKYYELLKEQNGQPFQRIVAHMRNYLAGDVFIKKYTVAYQKWETAEEMLWASDSENQLTTIGHSCREALQEFATALVDRYQLNDAEKDISKTVRRLKAVLEHKKEKFGKTEKPFLETLLNYWGTVSDIIQRQEHGGQKEGKPLVWEDGRRVVFQTAVVMYEIDSSLSKQRTE